MKSKLLIFVVIGFMFLSIVYAADVDPSVDSALRDSDSVRVIVKLKDGAITQNKAKGAGINSFEAKTDMIKTKQDSVLSRLNVEGEGFRKEGIVAQDGKGTKGRVSIASNEEVDFRLKHKYATINGFAGQVTSGGLDKLRNDPDVESIVIDKKAEVSLELSVPQIGGDLARGLQINGLNITGAGETVCVVDTGVDYTHDALGNCSISYFTIDGNNESYMFESSHPYANSFDEIWNITIPGFHNIAVHFKNISLEYQGEDSGYDTTDSVHVYDGNGAEIAYYHGVNGVIESLWSPSVTGDTIYIRLTTDSAFTDYGFYIDLVLNGTTNTTYNWSSCSKVIGGWDFVNNDPDPMDDHSHGTHCAGIVANDGTYNGVAPDAKIVAVKTLANDGTGWYSDIDAGIDWCTNNSEKLNISVITMSLGTTNSYYQSYCDNVGSFSLEKEVIDAAAAKDISVIIASGNYYPTMYGGGAASLGISHPSCLENATPVGSVAHTTDAIAYQRGNILDLLAPGGDDVSDYIYSTVLNDAWGFKTGTSMAAPHVAGAAALLKQFMKKWNGSVISPFEIERVLNATGLRVYDSTTSRYYSRIDVFKAIVSYDTIAPIVNFSSPTPANSTSILTVNFTVNVTVTDNLTIDTCLLSWNGTNESMTKVGSGISAYCYKNKNNISAGTYSYLVYVNDSTNNINYTETRILQINNSAPNITDYYPATLDFSIAEPSSQLFNISYSDVNSDSISVAWYKNGTLVSSSITYNFTGNYSSAGYYNITVIISDGSLTDTMHWNLTVNNTNALPIVQSISVSSTDSSNRTNGTLVGTFTYYDADSEPNSGNETRWYNNTLEVSSFANLTYVAYVNISKGQNWTFSARFYDGLSWGNWSNATITIANTAAILYSHANITVNETGLVNITLNATDVDSDTLTYGINSTLFSQSGAQFIWNTNISDSGAYMFRVNVSDSDSSAYRDILITVLDADDFDNDGNPDFNDTDDDNDGIDDDSDTLVGNLSNINYTTTIKLTINGSENMTRVFNSTLPVNITDSDNNTIVSFDWNFTNSTLKVNWTIDYNSTAGTLKVRNIDLSSKGLTKTVYVNKSSTSANYICIADDETTEPSSLPSDCSGYTRVACPGSSGAYTCSVVNTSFRVTGLSHSTLKTIYVAPTVTPSDDGGGSGGGGGGSSGGGAFIGSSDKKTIAFIDVEAGKTYSSVLDLVNLALTKNTFSVNKAIAMLKITMEKIEDTDVVEAKSGVYSYFRITAEGLLNSLNKAELEFKVNSDWLRVKGYDSDKVALYHYSDGWKKLNTYRVGQIDDDIYYVGTTNSFSDFAIASEPLANQAGDSSLDTISSISDTTTGNTVDGTGSTNDGRKFELNIPQWIYTSVLVLVLVVGLGFGGIYLFKRMRNPTASLDAFIKKCVAQGQTKGRVRDALLSAGWPRPLVDKELDKLMEKHQRRKKK